MSKLMHFLKINADSKREIGQCLFPDRPPFCFLLGMAYIFLLIVCLLRRKNHRVVLPHGSWTYFTWKKKKPNSSRITQVFLLRAWIELPSLCVTPRAAIRRNRESPVQFTYGVGKKRKKENLSTYEPGLAVRVEIYKVEWKGTRANYGLLKFA